MDIGTMLFGITFAICVVVMAVIVVLWTSGYFDD